MKTLIFLMVSLLMCSAYAFADWLGPYELVKGIYGTKEEQFGIRKGYIKPKLPHFIVDTHGNIIVGDKINNRIKIYSHTGQMIGIFGPNNILIPKNSNWPPEKMGLSENTVLVPWGNKYQYYDYSGNVRNEFTVAGTLYIEVTDGRDILVYNKLNKEYHKYSYNGKLLERIS